MKPVFQCRFVSAIFKTVKNYNGTQRNILQSQKSRIISSYMCKSFHNTHQLDVQEPAPSALRNKKPKSKNPTSQYFVDLKQVNH